MSVQFGRWNFDGQPVDPEYVGKVDALLAPYGPDGRSSHFALGTTILYHAFHTTKESRREKQPHTSTSGAVITWDGRLDNRSELIRELADALTTNSTDLEIAAAAYEEWGEKSFAKLIGDWAVSIWNPATRCLTLAKDVIGTRHLYYAVEESGITWSTILDPLVLLAGRKFQLCEEYIAGWLGFFPATHLTPYIGIDSVPPSSFVRLQPGKREIQKYWDFDPHKRIRYRTDAEYEEHFRIVFAEAVRRRLRSDSPVLAELSGGMDSSSIVCMADDIIARGRAETPRVDTISYYDDSEPNWNERPHFTKVEQKRGRQGWHVSATDNAPVVSFRTGCLATTPTSCLDLDQSRTGLARALVSQHCRVVLSGIGGDEMTGGVPTPTPELMDLLVTGRLVLLLSKSKNWAVQQRRPWFRLAVETANRFVPAFSGITVLPKWITGSFATRNRTALDGYPSRVRLLRGLPSFQENLSALNWLRREISCRELACDPPHEIGYSYLDRDFVELMFAIPRDQIVRLAQRRSLMRRALADLVPAEILNRRRKAYVVRSVLNRILKMRSIAFDSEPLVSSSLGIVDAKALDGAIQSACHGEEVPLVTLARTLTIEVWLRRLQGELPLGAAMRLAQAV